MRGLIVSAARTPRLQIRTLTQLEIDLATGKLEMPGDAIDIEAETSHYDDDWYDYDDWRIEAEEDYLLADLDADYADRDGTAYAGGFIEGDYDEWFDEA